MSLLLDTHVFLWAVAGDDRLPIEVATRLSDPTVEVFVSAACVWEAAIKWALGRLPLDDIARLVGAITDSGFRELPVRAAHAAAVAQLEPLHRDPFDRLLLAQAQTDALTFVSFDDQVRRYPGVEFLPAL